MGGGQSKEAPPPHANGNGHHATNGSNGNPRRDAYSSLERRDSEDEDCTCAGLFSFCNPAASRRTNSNSKAKKTASDLLGTPILTPKLGDRRKQRTEGGTQQQPTLFMSRYGGLEKEPSADADVDAIGNGEGSWKRAPSAVVHEGMVSLCFAVSCMFGRILHGRPVFSPVHARMSFKSFGSHISHIHIIHPPHINTGPREGAVRKVRNL